MDFGQIWNVGVVGTLAGALEWLNALLVGAGFSFSFLSSWALTIILFTVIIKLVTLPLTLKQLKSSKAMQDVQPKLQALQKLHGKDKEKLLQEQMKLYKEHNVSPMAGCLPMIVQMPIWIGLYSALFNLAPQMETASFFWVASLARPEIPSFDAVLAWPPAIPILALLTGATQWVVQKMMTPRTTDPQQKATQAMMQFMPLMFIFFSVSVPAGLVLYWITSNVFSMVQQYFITGWGSLVPEKTSANGGATSEKRREPAAAAISRPSETPALPNGRSSDADSLKQSIPQTTSTGKKRRRRAK